MRIEVLSVSKKYGQQKVLDKISFTIDKGTIVGFLGPNGAGKSTMIKILTGAINPSEGKVLINGIDIRKDPIAIQRNIGYLPEHNPLYSEMYVQEYLRFRASVFSLKKTSVAQAIERVGLNLEATKKIGNLSKGYQQRVGLAAAILHNPSVLILDEPTTGLDPNQLVDIRTLIKELSKDKIVLFSTHILQEVTAICSKVLLINKGKLLVNRCLKEIRQSKEQIIEATFDRKFPPVLLEQLPHLSQLNNIEGNRWIFNFNTLEDMRPQIFDFASAKGMKILELTTVNKSVEALFKEFTA